MISEYLQSTLMMSRSEFILYMVLSFLIAWILKIITHKDEPQREWKSYGPRGHAQQGHTYLEYVPEMYNQFQGEPQHGSSLQSKVHNHPPHENSTAQHNQAIPTRDDFSLIEGIDSATQQLLYHHDINTFSDLDTRPVSELQELLQQSGLNEEQYDISSWVYQAHMAVQEEWDKLSSYQMFLRERLGT